MSRAGVEITEALVRRLVETQFPEFAERPLHRFPGEGTDNAIYRLGDDLAVRLPRVDWAKDTPPREQRLLGRFQEIGLGVPRPYGLGYPDFGYEWPWAIVSWIDGKPVGMRQLQVEEAELLARTILRIRRLTPDLDFIFGPANNNRGAPLAGRDELFRTALQSLEDEFDTARLRGLWEDALAADERFEPVWLHGDLHGGNVLDQDGTICALIDWGLAGVGDGACDLSAAWAMCDEAGRNAFRVALEAASAEWLRGMGWALSTACIYMATYRSQPGVSCDMQRRTIRQIELDFA